jgi:hypothetical protein
MAAEGGAHGADQAWEEEERRDAAAAAAAAAAREGDGGGSDDDVVFGTVRLASYSREVERLRPSCEREGGRGFDLALCGQQPRDGLRFI